MTGTAQLPLELAPRPALGREDFLVAPSNEVAVAWIDRWPDWPGPALGEHNREVLCDILGLDGPALAALEERGVV